MSDTLSPEQVETIATEVQAVLYEKTAPAVCTRASALEVVIELSNRLGQDAQNLTDAIASGADEAPAEPEATQAETPDGDPVTVGSDEPTEAELETDTEAVDVPDNGQVAETTPADPVAAEVVDPTAEPTQEIPVTEIPTPGVDLTPVNDALEAAGPIGSAEREKVAQELRELAQAIESGQV